jgi:hypothetical protein
MQHPWKNWQMSGDSIVGAAEFEPLGELQEELLEDELGDEAAELELIFPGWSAEYPTSSMGARRKRPSKTPTTPERAALPSDVHSWILSTDRSAIELIAEPAKRNRFLREIDWTQEHFPGDETGGLAGGRLAEELFTAMARVVPERRVPYSLKYRPDIADIVVPIPREPKTTARGCRPYKMLHPEASNAFVRLRDKAATDGIPINLLPGCRTAWRTPAEQADISRSRRNRLAVARGIGPHMYGLAVDLRLGMPGVQVGEANTRTPERMANVVRMYRSAVYKWMALYGSRFGWFPYRREPWHWEYNPPGFKERYEGWPGKNREVGFESESDFEEELEDEVAELEPLSPRPDQYPRRDSGLTSLVAQSELEHWARVRPRPQMRRRPVAQPRTPVGNSLIPFTSRTIPKYRDAKGKLQSTLCAVCVPNAAWKQTAVDLLVFFHGDQIDSPGPCKHDFDPEKVIQNFLLDVQLDRSGRKVALAVPVVHWIRGDNSNLQGKWTAENLNKFVDEVLDEIGRQSGVKPTLRRLIIAGHSHAYAILTPLALEFQHGVPATRERALAKLNDVWALDSTYGGSARTLDSWARALPNGRFIAVLNKQSGVKNRKTPIDGWNNTFSRGAGPPSNLRMCKVEEIHCVIPTKYIGQLLSATSNPPSWCAS